MKKTTVKPDPDFARAPKGNAPATRLTATLTDGTTVVQQVDDMPGFPGLPVGRDGMERKFRSNTAGRWDTARTDAILKALWDFEHASDLRSLLGQMAFA